MANRKEYGVYICDFSRDLDRLVSWHGTMEEAHEEARRLNAAALSRWHRASIPGRRRWPAPLYYAYRQDLNFEADEAGVPSHGRPAARARTEED